MKRKLTTIFCADVSGYSRMMGADEARTLTTLKEYREAIEGFIERHHGRVVSWSGDGLLAEFSSVVEAVQCAAEVQSELKLRNGGRDEDQRMTFRIGINLGDVMADGDDIFGEGVNIAARLQQMAAPGGILVSAPVYEQVRGKLSMQFAALGQQAVKNIAGEVGIYSVTVAGVTPAAPMSTTPPAWGDPAPLPGAPAKAKPVEKRGKLFRRGIALLLDYMIVGVSCIAGAVVLNAVVDPNIIRMDLDLPLIEYGDVVERTPWKLIETVHDDNAVGYREERRLTYDYYGLFRQTYLQRRERGEVQFPKDRKDAPGRAAPPESAAPPAPAAPPEAPAPPPPPPPPVPPVSVPGVEVGPDGSVKVPGVEVSPDGGVKIGGRRDALVIGHGDDEDGGISLSIGSDGEDGVRLGGSLTRNQLIDPVTGQAITRPSLDTLSLILLVLYFAALEGGLAAASIGKRAFDLAVTREDGAKLSFGAALGRNIVKVLTFFIFPVTILVALFSRRRQAIHDLIARTVVVHRMS
jgi:class 3 adenylate cyclase